MIFAFFSGIMMAVQGAINGALSREIGLLETTFLVHASGTLVLALILLIVRGGQERLHLFPDGISWFLYSGGLFGVLIIYLVAASIPEVGAGKATTAIIVGQMGMAFLLDHFGFLGLEVNSFGIRQLLGLLLLAMGGKLLIK